MFQNSVFCPEFTFVFCTDFETATLFVYSIKCLVCTSEKESVYCAVRSDY